MFNSCHYLSCIQILRTDTGFQDFIFHQDFFLLDFFFFQIFFLQFKYLLSTPLCNELSKISKELGVDIEQSNTREFKIQYVLCCAQSLSCVQLFTIPQTMVRQAPLSMGILQVRILEWVAIPSSRGSSQPRDRTQVSKVDSLPSEPPGKILLLLGSL